VIGLQVRVLWNEVNWLQAERAQIRQSSVIGYPNISPRISFAERPANWLHHEGEFTYLWGGWDPLTGHRWFRIGRGEMEEAWISSPIGRDVYRAIDEPLYEVEGGEIWGRIPADAPVVGLVVDGLPSVYPVLVLDKVQVVNEVVCQRPILVSYNAFAPPEGSVRVYDAVLDGQRVTMGSSGYYQGGIALLYDRDSESLWKPDKNALRAIAGPRKGQTLRQIAQPIPIAWSDVRGRYRTGRLLIGAARAHPPSRVLLGPERWEGH
jgi:hypothetical protein